MDILFDIFMAPYVMFFIVGVILVAAGVAMIVYEIRVTKRATKITGTFSGVAKEERSRGKNKGSAYYYPLISFIDPHGKQIEFKGRIGSSALPSPEKIGTPVTVLYTEGEKPKIKGKGMYVFGIILTIMGFIFGGVYIANFDFNWASALFCVGVLGFIIFKVLQAFSKIDSVRNANSLRGAIDALIAEKNKFTTENAIQKYIKVEEPDYIKLSKTGVQKAAAKQTVPLWLTLIFAAASIGLLVGAVISFQNQSEFLATAHLTDGQVIDFKESYDSENHSYTYSPIIRFSVQGQSIQFTDNMGSSHPSEQVGDTVPVLYNPMDYNNAQMDKGVLNWVLPSILGLMGIFFSFGTYQMFKARKKYQAQKNQLSA